MLPKATPANFFWLIVYLVTVGAAVWKLSAVRQPLIDRFSTPQAQAEWDDWRAAARKEATGEGPVRRREPKSPEPNLLVLLRDYWGVCVTATVVFVSLLFGVMMIFVRGAMGTGRGDE